MGAASRLQHVTSEDPLYLGSLGVWTRERRQLRHPKIKDPRGWGCVPTTQLQPMKECFPFPLPCTAKASASENGQTG